MSSQFTRAQHLAKSRNNENFAAALHTATTAGREWAVTALFYAALHCLQAYFAARTDRIPITHGHRSSAIQRDAAISGAYDEYRELSDLSRSARYDCEVIQPGHVRFAQEWLASIKAIVAPHL